MRKAELINHWAGLPVDVNPVRFVKPVPYKALPGSRYGQYSGVRIDGDQAFIDACLGRLKGLLAAENHGTRLEVSYKQASDRDTGEPMPGAYACYIRVVRRGREAMPGLANPGLLRFCAEAAGVKS